MRPSRRFAPEPLVRRTACAAPIYTLDVFTDTPLAGNPLAVVLDCAGPRRRARCRASPASSISSETVFVPEPRNAVNTAAVRIFTPGARVAVRGPSDGRNRGAARPFARAGLAEERGLAHRARREDRRRRLHRAPSPGRGDGGLFPPAAPPERIGEAPSDAALAADLGIAPRTSASTRIDPVVMGAGTANLFVPLKSLDAMAQRAAGAQALGRERRPLPLPLYARHRRMPARIFMRACSRAGWGVYEDPATGAPAAAFAGVLMAFEPPGDGEHMSMIEQGYEMGRPSLHLARARVEDGQLADATIGGSAVIVCEGTIDL